MIITIIIIILNILNIKFKYSQFWILISQSIIYFLLYLWKLMDNVSYSNLTQKFKLYSWVYVYHSWKEKKIHFWKNKNIYLMCQYHIVIIWFTRDPLRHYFGDLNGHMYKKDRCITIEWWYVLRKSFEFIGIQGINIL